MVNGVDYWAITKLDVLDEMETIKVCVAYECDGKRYETVPACISTLERCKPIYKEFPGWMAPTSGIQSYDELPAKAKAYVQALCDISGVPMGVLSVSPKRHSTFRVAI